MALVWRLTRPEYADQLDGEGAGIAGGRWNSRGLRALYTSAHLSLSVLEVYVNIPPGLRDDLPTLRAIQVSVPDDAGMQRVTREEFAALMESADPISASRMIGDDWIGKNSDLVLEVPSVLISEETNLILNPAHARMRDVAILSTRSFHFDPRLVVAKT